MSNEEVESALWDVQRYLLDQIPPITATEAVQVLMTQPPALLMKQMNAFAIEQGRIQGASMADCLFHALKKVHMISTLRLIEHGALERYLNGVIPMALAACPAEDRETLKANLANLRNTLQFVTPVSAVELGVPAEKKKPGVGLTEVAAKTARTFSLVIDRLLRKTAGGAAAGAAEAAEPQAGVPVEQPVAQLASMAVDSSSSEEELNQFLESLKPLSGGKPMGDIINVLASSVPGWELVGPMTAGAKPGKSIQAMHKIISLTKDQTVSTTRLRGLVICAMEQFNTGSIGAASSMLDLAQVIIAEKKIDANTVERIRNDALDALSSEQLKKYTENKAKHPILRKVLGFFPKLRKETLFADLRGEQKPERRRAVLSLLEAYGSEARDAALDELEKELNLHAGEADTYYLRNLIYLLHRVPRESDEAVQKEFEMLKRSSEIGQNIFVIKEAVLPLGQIKTDNSVKLLTTRLAEFEALLLRSKEGTPYPVDEVQKLLDRIISALAKIGTPAALLTVARHGMRANPILGDTRARLAALSQYDLSFDEQTVNIIVKTVREDLPSGKLLGRLIPKKQPPPIRLIEALSGTRSEVVEKLFAEIAQNYPDEEIGRAAAAALENRGKPVAPGRESATLTGDLQFFGLPSLMQSLSDNQATGIVTLTGKQGTIGKLLFVAGQFADAQASHLRGVDALYQLLERPIVGSFAFVPAQPENVRSKNAPQPIMGLLLEGMRRYDELKQVSVVAPDDLVVKPTQTKPAPPPEESDPAIIREVWVNASKGGKLSEWEAKIAVDSYRIRRLVAHWIDQGALQPAS
ncbi:MAG TPA: DUF4388 domain-containing protein [Thermoanaerobaculia bacterium]|nr:DUF4388 domain-containing protein [Thermoanaerobaculia bacterium]